MKKYITTIAFSSLLLMTGCDFLDYDESQGKTQEEAYGYFENLKSLAITAYRELPKDYGVIGGALREAATDNAVSSWTSNAVYDIYNNVWSPKHLVDDRWDKYYPVIHDINSFLELYSEDVLKRFEWDDNYEKNIKMCRNSLYEVRAMRAFYYFELIKRYKDVPLLKNTCTLDEVNSLPKTPFKDVLQFMVEEWDEVADKLPEDYENFYGETGRVTKGAALAFKSRALLYAASPLYADFSGVTWEQAAKAALDVINLGVYSLPSLNSDPIFQTGLTGHEILTSPQLIFEFRESSQTNDFEKKNLPPTFTPGLSKGTNNPTQNLVDAYELNDGTEFDWDNPEHVKNMYYDKNGQPTRDPRLYINVLCNGMKYMDKEVETFVGGLYGPHAEEGYTLTGYYLKKLLNETVKLNPNGEVKKPHHYPGYRYAEILLNYAEALNEFQGPDYKDAEFTMSAREALNKVRSAAGMPEVVAADQAAFRTKVRNERRVELAFEDHRFWDIRRWKIGEVVKDIYGVRIENSYGQISYKKEKIQTRIWDDKMYFYPIPQKEVYVNPNLTQNPGWE